MTHSNLPPGVAIGPDGKFISVEDQDALGDRDLEYVHIKETYALDGSNQSGTTANTQYASSGGFEGHLLIDIEDVIDRHEVAHLVGLNVGMNVQYLNRGSSVHTALWGVELSASPKRSDHLQAITSMAKPDDVEGDEPMVDQHDRTDDTADLLTRPLQATVSSGTADSTNGLASGPETNWDRVAGPMPGTWDFDRRDEVYTNALIELNGSDTADMVATLTGWFLFDVRED